MKSLALALALMAGCTAEGPSEPPAKPGRSLRRDVCPGNHCWGMHSFAPPSTCERCGAQGLPTSHRLCQKCASEQSRCAHCSGKLPDPGSR